MSACVAFGPDGGYFFNSPNQWTLDLLPPGLIEWFRPQPRVSEVYTMALGHAGAYVCAFRTLEGTDQLVHNNLPPALLTWLINPQTNLIQHNIRTLQIALGPTSANGAPAPFFTHDTSTSSATWSTDLPSTLLSALNTRFRCPVSGSWLAGHSPSHVSLGFGNSYIYISTSGSFSWDLCGQNPALNDFLAKTQSLAGGRVFLDAFRPGVSIALLSSGIAPSRLPKGDKQAEAQKALAEDWRMVCQKRRQEVLASRPRSSRVGGVGVVGAQAQAQAQQWQQQQAQQQRQQAAAQVHKIKQVNTGLKVAGATLGVANFLASC